MMVGRLVSFWEGLFSGAMLNFGRVMIQFPRPKSLGVKVQPRLRSVFGGFLGHKFHTEDSGTFFDLLEVE